MKVTRDGRLMKVEVSADGAGLVSHAGGGLLAGIADLGVDVLDVDHMVDLRAARAAVGPRVVLTGNIDPASAVRHGKPDAIRARMRQCLAEAGAPGAAVAGVAHGTTVAPNAVLARRGGRTAPPHPPRLPPGPELPPRAAHLVEIASSGSIRLGRLVNDILEIERLDTGMLPLTVRTHDVAAACKEAVVATSGMAQAAGVRLHPGPTAGRVRADRDPLRQV